LSEQILKPVINIEPPFYDSMIQPCALFCPRRGQLLWYAWGSGNLVKLQNEGFFSEISSNSTRPPNIKIGI